MELSYELMVICKYDLKCEGLLVDVQDHRKLYCDLLAFPDDELDWGMGIELAQLANF